MNQLTNKLDAFVEQQKESRTSGISKAKTIEEFKIIFKYLAFVACSAKAPIRQKMLDAVIDLINKAGSPENIQRWCAWTPTQLSLMKLAHTMSRVVLMGGNGTGKTLMLETYAIKIAKENPNDDVIFAIHKRSSSYRPLLHLQQEVRFEEFQNVTVKTFTKVHDLTLKKYANAHICIDEVGSDVPIGNLQKIPAKSLWVVLRDSKAENSEDDLKLPGWHIVNLTYPLRTSKTISEKVKESKGEGYFYALENQFNESLEITENMPVGPEPLTIPGSIGSYKERMQHVFNVVSTDKPALVIISYEWMDPTPEEIQVAKQTTSYDQLSQKTDSWSINYLVGIEAVKACDRPKPPLIWLRSNIDSYDVSDDKEKIKAWMKGSKEFIGCDLITDPQCIAGIEADVVIYLGSLSSSVTDVMSRCRGQFFHIPPPDTENVHIPTPPERANPEYEDITTCCKMC